MIKIAGKDSKGLARPLSVMEDDSGQFVLRVVDAAPFLVEYGKFDNAIHTSHSFDGRSKKILNANADRKFVSFTNISENNIYLSLGANANFGNGMLLKPNQTYEMSTMRGNLFKGDIYGISEENFSGQNLFDKTLLSQGGLFPSSGQSDNPRRVTSFPYSLVIGKKYRVAINHETIRIRNITGYDSVDFDNGWAIVWDGVYEEKVFTPNRPLVGISFCKVDINENLTPSEVAEAEITLFALAPSLLVTEGV